MSRFVPNPAAEANVGFDVIQPGTYKMRVKAITEFKSKEGNECLKVQLEYLDPTSLTKIDGQPAKSVGNIFDNGLVTSPAEKQGRLRNFVESCGKSWSDINDTDELIGCELDVKVKLDIYNGEQSNKVGRYLKPE